MREDVEIFIEGRGIGGWDSFQFTNGLDKIASGFSFSTTRSPSVLTQPTITQNEIQVKANGDLLLTGFVEAYEGTVDSDAGRTLNIKGRSKTADLIDSDVTGHFRNQNTLQIIEKLVAPFGIEIETDITSWNVHQAFTVESGSKVKDAIHNGLQIMRGAKVSSTAEGKLRIWQSDYRPSQGAVGKRIKSATLKLDETKRFSDYEAKAQDATFFNGVQASEIIGKAQDTTSRFRRRIIHTYPNTNTPDMRETAERAARRAFGKARQLTIDVSGWRDENGLFWQPNSTLWVDLPEFNIGQELLITNVALSKDLSSGTSASLQLEPIEAHSSVAKVAKKPRPTTQANSSFPNTAPPSVSSDTTFQNILQASFKAKQ